MDLAPGTPPDLEGAAEGSIHTTLGRSRIAPLADNPRMEIGKPERITTVEPIVEPIPREAPADEPTEAPEREPVPA
jgi:hypothetical protein